MVQNTILCNESSYKMLLKLLLLKHNTDRVRKSKSEKIKIEKHKNRLSEFSSVFLLHFATLLR